MSDFFEYSDSRSEHQKGAQSKIQIHIFHCYLGTVTSDYFREDLAKPFGFLKFTFVTKIENQ